MSLRLALVTCIYMFSIQINAAESVETKNQGKSELSDYFAKINSSMSNDSESQSLDQEKSNSIDESEILLTDVQESQSPATGLSSFQKMFISIAGLILFAVGFFAMIQKWGRKEGHKSISSQIKVLTQKSLGPKKQLVLIRIAGETILLGVTDQNINNIKTLSLMDDELPDFIEPKFSGQLKKKIEETQINDEVESVDGFSISRLDDVKNEVSKRYLNS